MNFDHDVIDIKNQGFGNYFLKVARNNVKFKAGQFFSLGTFDMPINREYSVCSGEHDDYLEFLIREISDGILSKRLKILDKNEKIKILGPYGNFYLKKIDFDKKYIFIASGTGISPFISLIKTYPNIKFKIYHGIRLYEDAIESLEEKNYLKFISREKVNKKNCFDGRLTLHTDIFKNEDKNSYIFLCGNSLMVTELYDILVEYDFKPENIFTEIFF